MAVKSEFASLSDLVLAKGIPHSELLEEITDKIIYEYKKLYGQKSLTVEVFVNEQSGEVRLMKDGKDVTPGGFSDIAEKLAREVLIEKLKNTPEPVKETEEPKKTKSDGKLGRFIMAVIFWGYNIIYIFVAVAFLVSFATDSGYREGVIENIKDLGIFGKTFIATAALVPFITVATAVWFYSKKIYDKLSVLFFFFEVPVIIISLIFSSAFTNPAPYMWFVFMMILFSVPAFLIYLLNPEVKSPTLMSVVLFINESLSLFSVYIAILFSFFTPLIVGYLGKSVFEFLTDTFLSPASGYYGSRYFNPGEAFLTVIFGGFYILIILCFTAIPYFIAYFFTRLFFKAKSKLEETSKNLNSDRLAAIFAVIWFTVFAITAYQPNADTYIKKLQDLQKIQDFEERETIAKELIPQEGRVRRVFDDLRNVRGRYLMAKSDDVIKDAYIDELNFSKFGADLIQGAFNLAAYPFVYQGSLDRQNEALLNFEYLFGNKYRTYKPVETKNVELLNRKISLTTDYNNTVASVSVEEEYKTSLSRDQEVIYEFSLTPDSALTELKLGPDLEFEGIIAPKGAAASVYQREVNRSRDPALLEETGPNQYRLRIFPIPGTSNRNLLKGKNQKVKFTYVTLLTPRGFAFPLYSKKQNINDKGNNTVSFNNSDGRLTDNFITNDALMSKFGSYCSDKSLSTLKSAVSGSSLYLAPNPAITGDSDKICTKEGVNLADLIKGMKIAVLLDVSFAGKGNDEIKNAINFLKDGNNLSEVNEIDLYRFNDLLSKPVRINKENMNILDNLTYFGTGNWVSSFNKLSGDYDFAVLITNSDDTAIIEGQSLNSTIPLYMVHERFIPPYTGKLTGELMQGGGRSFNRFSDAFNTAVLTKLNPELSGKKLFSAGTFYSLYSDTDKDSLLNTSNWQDLAFEKNDPASLLFAKKFADGKIDQSQGNLNTQLSLLDMLNKFSKTNSVVTPYSSLIALVNEIQIQNLVTQSQNYDRYKDTSVNPPPTPLRSPGLINLNPLESFSGVDTLSLDIPSGSGGGGATTFGGISNPAMGGGGISISPGGQFAPARRFDGISAFILLNIILLGVGVVGFFLTKLKNFRKVKK